MMKMRGRKRKRWWGPWEQVANSSQPGAGLGVQVGPCLVGAPQECWARDAFAVFHRRLSQLSGGGLEEEEGGDPSVLGGGGEACLCGEMLPGRGETEMEGAHLDGIQH